MQKAIRTTGRLAILVGLAALGVWFLADRHDPKNEIAAPIAQRDVVQANQIVVQQEPSTDKSGDAKITGPVSKKALFRKPESVVKEFISLTDARSFIDKFATPPVSPAAAQLLQKVLVTCSMYSDISLSRIEKNFSDAGDTTPYAVEKLATVSRFRKACSGLFQLSSDAMLEESRKFTPAFDGKSDSLSKSHYLAVASNGRTREENLSDFEAIVKSRDPLAYANLGGFLGAAGASERWTMETDGASISPRMLGMAFAAAPCYFDGECERSQFLLDSQCIFAGDLTKPCQPNNILDAIKNNALPPAEFERLLAVLEWLRPGIDKGEWPKNLFGPLMRVPGGGKK